MEIFLTEIISYSGKSSHIFFRKGFNKEITNFINKLIIENSPVENLVS